MRLAALLFSPARTAKNSISARRAFHCCRQLNVVGSVGGKKAGRYSKGSLQHELFLFLFFCLAQVLAELCGQRFSNFSLLCEACGDLHALLVLVPRLLVPPSAHKTLDRICRLCSTAYRMLNGCQHHLLVADDLEDKRRKSITPQLMSLLVVAFARFFKPPVVVAYGGGIHPWLCWRCQLYRESIGGSIGGSIRRSIGKAPAEQAVQCCPQNWLQSLAAVPGVWASSTSAALRHAVPRIAWEAAAPHYRLAPAEQALQRCLQNGQGPGRRLGHRPVSGGATGRPCSLI